MNGVVGQNSSLPLDTSLRLSIITVCFNNADGLFCTLESIREQLNVSKSAYEVVVVDGGSHDHTRSVIDRFDDLSIIFLSEEDRNVYDAMNKGTRLSTGEYLLFLNAGDYFFDTNSLRHAMVELETEPTWLICGAARPDAQGNLVTIQNIPHNWFRHAWGIQSHCHQSTIFSRELLSTLSGYSEDFAFIGDFDLFLRAGMVSPPKLLVERITVYEGGGMSEARASEIPSLQFKVRSERLMYPPWLRRLDLAYCRYLCFRTSLARKYRVWRSRTSQARR